MTTAEVSERRVLDIDAGLKLIQDNFPTPYCWYGRCPDMDSDDMDMLLCKHLDWFCGEWWYDAQYTEEDGSPGNIPTVCTMEWEICNGRSWPVYTGDLAFLAIGLSVEQPGEIFKMWYAVRYGEWHSIPCPSNYGEKVWAAGEDTGVISMMEREHLDQIIKAKKAEEKRLKDQQKSSKKKEKEMSKKSQATLF